MDSIPSIDIKVQDHHFGGIEGLKSILNDYYENALKQLTESERKVARRFLEEGLIVSGRRVGITEGVEKERYGIEQELLEKLLDSRLIRIENTHLGKSYEISHDTLVPPIIESYKKRQVQEEQQRTEKLLKEEHEKLVIERKKRRNARLYAIIGFSLFFLTLLMGAIAYKQSFQIKEMAEAGDIRGKGYQVAKSNPSLALRLAQASLETDPGNTNSKHLMRDLINAYPPHFCSAELWVEDYISGLTFFSDNQHFVSISWDGSLIKSTVQGDIIFKIKAHEKAIQAVAVSNDDKYIATGSVDNTVKLWDAQGNFVRNIGNHLTDIQSLIFTPEGNRIITGSWDGTLRLWSIEGQLLHDFIGHQNVINDLTISPDGKYLVSVAWDKQVIIWDLNKLTQYKLINDFHYGIESVAFAKSNSDFWISDWEGKVQLWNINGEKLNEIQLDGVTASDLLVSLNGHSIFLALSDHTLKEFDLKGNEVRQFENHTDALKALAISADGNYLVSGGTDYRLSIWPLNGLKTTELKTPLSGIWSSSFFPDEEKIFTGGRDSIAYIINTKGAILQQLKGHSDEITTVAVSPDGEHLASGGIDNSIILWDKQGKKLLKIDTFTSDINMLVFSPDGQKILAGSNTFEAKLFDLNGTVLATFKGHTSDVKAVAFSPDGKYVLTGSRDYTARLWDLEGNLVREFKGHEKDIYAVDFSPDGQYVLTGSNDKSIKLWSFSGACLNTLKGHSASIFRVAFSPDSKCILSSSLDKTVKLWDIKGNELQSYTGHSNIVTDIQFSTDGKYIWSSDLSGNIQKWMTWKTFIESDRLLKLNETQQYNYGLITNPPVDSINRKLKIAMHYERGSPNYHLLRCKQFSYKAQQRAKEGSLSKQILDERELAKAYSIKAFFSPELSEKKYYQDKCTKLMLNIFNIWPFSKPPSGGTENVLIFSQANQCLWAILDNNPQKAYQIAQSGIKYKKGWPKVQTFLKTRLALASFYKGEYESAKEQLLKVKDLKLYAHEHQGKDFSIPYAMSHGIDLDTTLTLGDMIVQDIELLEQHNIINPEASNLKQALRDKN